MIPLGLVVGKLLDTPQQGAATILLADERGDRIWHCWWARQGRWRTDNMNESWRSNGQTTQLVSDNRVVQSTPARSDFRPLPLHVILPRFASIWGRRSVQDEWYLHSAYEIDSGIEVALRGLADPDREGTLRLNTNHGLPVALIGTNTQWHLKSLDLFPPPPETFHFTPQQHH
jgi:hypothetical protein